MYVYAGRYIFFCDICFWCLQGPAVIRGMLLLLITRKAMEPFRRKVIREEKKREMDISRKRRNRNREKKQRQQRRRLLFLKDLLNSDYCFSPSFHSFVCSLVAILFETGTCKYIFVLLWVYEYTYQINGKASQRKYDYIYIICMFIYCILCWVYTFNTFSRNSFWTWTKLGGLTFADSGHLYVHLFPFLYVDILCIVMLITPSGMRRCKNTTLVHSLILFCLEKKVHKKWDHITFPFSNFPSSYFPYWHKWWWLLLVGMWLLLSLQ